MNDYYGFAAFFSQIGRKQAEDRASKSSSAAAAAKSPTPSRTSAPTRRSLRRRCRHQGQGSSRSPASGWLPQTIHICQNLANIVWAHFLGKGIVDSVDDVRISNRR